MPEKKPKNLLTHYDTFRIETSVNFIHANLIKAKIYQGQKPDRWDVKIEDSMVEKVEFEPTSYITPTEAIIQRVIMGVVRDLVYSFKGTPKEFKNKEFQIRTGEIQDLLPKKRLHREIRSSFDKLMRFRMKVFVPKWNEVIYEAILTQGKYIDTQDIWRFKANPVFQIMRKEAHRDLDGNFQSISLGIEGKTSYRKLYIRLDKILLLKSRIHQLILLFFVKEFEESNCQVPSTKFQLTNDSLEKVFNKKLTKNDVAKFKNAVDEIMEMDDFKKLFQWMTTKKTWLAVRFYDK
jgi:hypothetical protein